MKSSHYTILFLLAGCLALGACKKNPSFAGAGASAGSGSGTGGSGGGGNGGGGGGPGVSIEPRMVFGPNQSPGFGGIQIAGDASKVVFVDDSNEASGNPDGEFQLFSIDLNSGALVQITDGSATAVPALFDFDITDSGDSVVWATSDDITGGNPNNQTNIFRGLTNGGGITQVTSIDAGSAFNPKISGNGSVVVFRSDNDLTGDNPATDTQIFSIGSDGTGLTQVTMTAPRMVPNSLAFSDDGSTIAFESTGDPFGTNADGSWEIFVVDVDGNNLTQVTATDGDSFSSKISDDGALVAFASRAEFTPGSNPDGNYELYVGQADGSGVVQVSNGDRDAGTFQSGAPGAFDISGNGGFVVFASSADLDGDNAELTHTLYWATSAGASLAQVLRDGTVGTEATANRGDQPGMTNDGLGIVFESDVNLTSLTQPDQDKLYTTIRQ